MKAMSMQSGSAAAAADYYRSLTGLYRWYGGTAHGWHYGIYDGDVAGHSASLAKNNELLLDGLETAGLSLLDVGCGEGGFSVYAAGRGHVVTGVTLCAEHVHLARALARDKGVGGRCRFLVADMDAMPFPDASFDAVVNQETWCHSQRKAAYLRGVLRILKPGGVFSAVDLAIGDGSLSPRVRRQYRDVCEGFQVPSLVSAEEARRDLAAAGYTDISVVDMTRRVRRAALLILLFSAGPHLVTRLTLDRWIYGTDERLAGHYRRHVAACMAFNRGLRSGTFRYLYVTGRKPL